MANIISLLGPDYRSETYSQSQQSLVNFYLEPATNNEGPGVVALPTPGLVEHLDLRQYGTPRVGGAIRHRDSAYVVHAGNFIEIDSNDNITVRGTLNTTNGRLSMSAIETEILIVDGTSGYSYRPNDNTFQVITDQDFPHTTKTIVGITDYFVAVEEGTQIFYVSELADGRTWSTLDFAAPDTDWDRLVRVAAENNRLWLFGEHTTEIWQNSGAQLGAPFDRISSGAIQYGIAAIDSLATFDNSVYFLAQNRNGVVGVMQASINGADNIVSTPPMMQDIYSYREYRDAFAFMIQQKGHYFYCITFPTAISELVGVTWMYDISTQSWSIFENYEQRGIPIVKTRHKANYVYSLNNKTYAGDYREGIIWEISPNEYTENNTPILRTIVSRHITSRNEVFRLSHVELECDVGVGNYDTIEAYNPEISLQVSRDKGMTYGNIMTRTLGTPGETTKRVIWGRLGSARSFTIKIEFSSPVPLRITGLWAHVEAQDNQLRGENG